MVDLIIARNIDGLQIEDMLSNSEIGLSHGDAVNNSESLEEVLYIRHNGLNDITNLTMYIDGLSNVLNWADSVQGDGVLLDSSNNGVFDTNFKTGVGDSLINAINLGTVASGDNKIIKIKINIPSTETLLGERKFNFQFNFNYTV